MLETLDTGYEVHYPLTELRKAVDAIEMQHVDFLNDKAQNFAQIIKTDPKQYERFGIFWYHIKELMVNRAYDATAWWRFNTRNEYIYQLVDRGDELLNTLQGLYYFNENWKREDTHNYIRNGVLWSYSCFDEDFVANAQ